MSALERAVTTAANGPLSAELTMFTCFLIYSMVSRGGEDGL